MTSHRRKLDFGRSTQGDINTSPRKVRMGAYGMEKFVYIQPPRSVEEPPRSVEEPPPPSNSDCPDNALQPIDSNSPEFFELAASTSTANLLPELSPSKSITNENYAQGRRVYNNLDPKKFVVHMVLYFDDMSSEQILREAREMVDSSIAKSQSVAFSNKSFIVMSLHYGEKPEEDHLHILHDCSWSKNSCRCPAFKKGLFSKCKNKKKSNAFDLSEINSDTLGSLMDYLKQRPFFCFYYRTKLERTIRYEYPIESILRSEAKKNIGIEKNLCPDGTNCILGEKNRIKSEEAEEPLATGRSNKLVVSAEDIFRSMKNYVVTPLSNVNLTALWLEEEQVSSVEAATNKFKKAMFLYEKYYSELSFLELMELHGSSDLKKLYGCLNDELLEHYFDESTSVEFLERYIIFQAEANKLSVKEFLSPIYGILSKKGSKNALLLFGPEVLGCLWFKSLLAELMINFIEIDVSFDKKKHPFEKCGFKNLLTLELNGKVPQKFESILKQILSGKETAVKSPKGSLLIKRTPVIICSEQDVFPNPYYCDTIHKIKLEKFCLANYDKKILPTAVITLFDKYEVY